MYYTALMSMLDEQNPEHYQHMKRMLAKNMKSFSETEGRDLYSFSYNYCIRMINAGQRDYQVELFQLYKQGLKQDLLLDKSLISEWDYKNIATLGARLKEFSWTEHFLQEYQEKLPIHRQENAYNYNLGNLYYNKGLYEEALSALLLVQFTDVKYHLSTTFLLLRTYYALRDTEALLSLIETFRIYVIRNRKMTSEQKRGYTNFLRFAKKLVLVKHSASTYSRKDFEKEIDDLRTKIESSENVINKYWLLEECQTDVKATA
jgi:tetratricopeptide (TPR) repeat protein